MSKSMIVPSLRVRLWAWLCRPEIVCPLATVAAPQKRRPRRNPAAYDPYRPQKRRLVPGKYRARR